MNRNAFWIGPCALAALISVGQTPADAATKARTRKTTAARVTNARLAPHATAYSAERSQSRKLKLARARERSAE